jgi:mRNA-degrading endonuclease toxin of MazEF toxin-antitoxin module
VLKSVKFDDRERLKISQVRTLSTRRPHRKISRVAPEELDRLVAGLNEIIATY